MTVKIYHHMKC